MPCENPARPGDARWRVLMVGRRRGALVAAAHLDAEVFLIDDGRRPERAAGAHAGARVRFDDLEGCVATARALLGGRPVDAVIAVVERAVLPAAAIRDALGAPGAKLAPARAWRDKLVMKERVRAAGIPTARSLEIRAGDDPFALVAALGLPLVIKPRASSGGRGTVIARTLGDVAAALSACGGDAMAESFVEGRELSVESILSRGEVLFENVTDYLRPGWANVVPATLPDGIDAAVRAMNRRALAALDVEDGMTHLEVFIRRDGEVVFGELAARPPGGSIMDLIHLAYGFDPWRAQLEVEIGRAPALPAAASASAGVWFLHPGEGEVVAVDGVDAARAVNGVVAVECSLTPGRHVERRVGVGQHHGRVLVRTDAHERTVHALHAAHARVRVATKRAA